MPPPTEQDAKRRRRWIRRGIALAVLIVGGSAFTAYFHRPLFRENLGIIDDGVVYRSAQPTGDVLAMIRDHKFASVVNLRGGKEADRWYAAEVEATRIAEVDFYDLPMSAVRRPSRRELLVLLDMLDRCSYPLLIHCKSGSDRTGLLTGLYLMYRKGETPERARAAFSLTHGHVPIFGPERLHEPFDEYAGWLAEHRQIHTPERFLDWVKHDYRARDPLVAIAPARPGPRTPRQAEPSTNR